ncbi:MAG: amidohydrolase [Pirellulales bacterium]|nr:amidohydrolase [Pirellulales bacterium]
MSDDNRTLDTTNVAGPFSRRELLRHAATATAVGALWQTAPGTSNATEPAAQEKEKPLDGWIDAHVHVWTVNTHDYPLAAGFRREEMRPPSFEPIRLLELARPCGVARIVLIQMSFYGFDNSFMLDTIAKYPGVFSGVAVIDDRLVAKPAAEMQRLAKLGVRGFRIYPRNVEVDRWLDDAGLRQMWAYGGEAGLAMCTLINPEALPAVDRMCEQYPATPVVIDHFARVGIEGEIRETDLAMLCKLARHKNTSVKLSAFYALGKKTPPYLDLVPMIRRVVEAYGPERTMWATDCPFQVVDHTYSQSIELIRDRCDFLSASDRESILRGTAQRHFFS